MTPEEARTELTGRIRGVLRRGASPGNVATVVLADVSLLMQAIGAKRTEFAAYQGIDGRPGKPRRERWSTQWQEIPHE